MAGVCQSYGRPWNKTHTFGILSSLSFLGESGMVSVRLASFHHSIVCFLFGRDTHQRHTESIYRVLGFSCLTFKHTRKRSTLRRIVTRKGLHWYSRYKKMKQTSLEHYAMSVGCHVTHHRSYRWYNNGKGLSRSFEWYILSAPSSCVCRIGSPSVPVWCSISFFFVCILLFFLFATQVSVIVFPRFGGPLLNGRHQQANGNGKSNHGQSDIDGCYLAIQTFKKGTYRII